MTQESPINENGELMLPSEVELNSMSHEELEALQKKLESKGMQISESCSISSCFGQKWSGMLSGGACPVCGNLSVTLYIERGGKK
jgi:hypothetical protein